MTVFVLKSRLADLFEFWSSVLRVQCDVHHNKRYTQLTFPGHLALLCAEHVQLIGVKILLLDWISRLVLLCVLRR